MSTGNLSQPFNQLKSQRDNSAFEKSCNRIGLLTKPLEQSKISTVLTYDLPEQASIVDAIGSMINPVSLFLRNITPLVSYPTRCPNYELVFRDRSGMADIKLYPNGDFHGLVHLVPEEQMSVLDEIEHIPIGTPSERYMDIIIKGCQHFQLDSSYIERLEKNHVVPRDSRDKYEIIQDVPDVYLTTEDLEKDDENNSKLIWINVNGKILKYIGLPPTDHPDYKNQKNFYNFALNHLIGRDIVYPMSKFFYEPLFPAPLEEKDICDDHRAFAEDRLVAWGLNYGGDTSASYWIPIGKMHRTT
ncbi:hypothetical protein I4U23_021800 [Adineta vaga]|nr:hypothetical protein I4U23_021800 [Adineta vaga]